MTSRLLLRGGCVLTLGEKTSNFTQADVLIDGEAIAEVGPGLRARDAEPVDASDTIVMPGFVDSHRHARRSLLRNLGGDASGGLEAAHDERYGPDEVYAATLVSLLGAVEAGITTVVDWSDATGDEGVAEAALRAHDDAGLRTVFVHRHDAPATSPLQRLSDAAGPRTTVALGAPLAGPADRLATAWATARASGMRIHAHRRSAGAERGAIAGLAASGLLGPDVTLVHCGHLDDAEAEAIASSGASVSLAPSSEMAGGDGPPPIQALIDRDVRPGLGTDDERVAPGDLFAQMRATISLQHATVFDRKLAGKAGLPRLMTTRDVIRFATLDGARAAGVAGVTGSLEPGKQADLVVLRTDRPNIFPINDPIGAVVWGMDTSNVDWVIAGGRVLMRDGQLQADVGEVRRLADAARQRVIVGDLVAGASSGGEG